MMSTTNRSKAILEIAEAGEDPTDFKDEDPKDSPMSEKNPRFRDVDETGSWGELQRNEIYGVGLFGVIAVVSIFFWIFYSSTNEMDISREQVKLDAVLFNLQKRNYNLVQMPDYVGFYDKVADNGSSLAYHRAMKWLLSDSYTVHGEYFLRFVLASLYFDLGGEAWKNSTNWLTNATTCDWFGLECALGNGHLQSLNLSNNNVTGTIPAEVTLLGNVSNIWLSDNSLHGTIPGEAFSKLSKLAVLFLDNNRLSGTIPAELGSIANLGIFYAHQNDLHGEWPFCPLEHNETKKYEKYGFDCEKVSCSEECCEDISCYESVKESN